MGYFRVNSLICVVLLLAIHPSRPSLAQQNVSIPVVIQVTDPAGAPIPYAQIQMIPSPQPTSEALEADAKGQALVNLKPGGYCIAIASQGFMKLEDHFEVAGPKTISFKLSVGGCTECVTVTPTTANSLLLRVVPSHGIKPLVITPANLAAMPHKTITFHNVHTSADETYSGVPLIYLLGTMGVPRGKDLHGKVLSEYVVATGSDGYKAVLALAEVDPEFHPGDVIVADTMDGQPLDEKNGPFKLVVTEDKRPARSVHNLVSIDVKTAE